MGERQVFQPLTREDRITVLLYRVGIVLSAASITALALLSVTTLSPAAGPAILAADILLYGLFASVGLCVFFIHLYIGRLKVWLQYLYAAGIACLAALLVLGNGSAAGALLGVRYAPLLLLPLSGCLGFVTAKEAFCFRLLEGYILAMLMPFWLLLVSIGALGVRGAASGLAVIAVLLLFFTLRKAFMPLAYDIGDKSAYQ